MNLLTGASLLALAKYLYTLNYLPNCVKVGSPTMYVNETNVTYHT